MKKLFFVALLTLLADFSFAQKQVDDHSFGNLGETVQQDTSSSDEPMSFQEYKQKVCMEKGRFLELGSLAYNKYQSYNAMKWSGVALLSTGFALAAPVGIPLFLLLEEAYFINNVYSNSYVLWVSDEVPGIVCMSIGGGMMVAGAVLLGCMGIPLQQSYYYYVQGQKKSVSMNWHPTFGTGYAGAGLTVRF